MRFRIEIERVHPINSLSLDIDLSKHGIWCIAGKHGVGKTTLTKAIMNFMMSDIFVNISSDGIFNNYSSIRYFLDDEEFLFTYDSGTRSITTRKPIPANYKTIVSVELLVPHSQRFTFFRTLADQDREILQAIYSTWSI